MTRQSGSVSRDAAGVSGFELFWFFLRKRGRAFEVNNFHKSKRSSDRLYDQKGEHNSRNLLILSTKHVFFCCTPAVCLLTFLASPFLLFMRFHSGHMLWWKHAYSHTHTHKHTHIHELAFSLCPYALSGAVLLLCCSQTGLFTAAQRQRRSGQPPTPPRWAALNQLHTPHTHKHTMAPSVTKLLLLGSS